MRLESWNTNIFNRTGQISEGVIKVVITVQLEFDNIKEAQEKAEMLHLLTEKIIEGASI